MSDSEIFPHEMLREIYEQPAALRRTLALYLDANHLRSDVADRLAEIRVFKTVK
jgi:glucosamine 6-phosphate synthetase-like amidotransferase/phosphosugar isomerase protein